MYPGDVILCHVCCWVKWASASNSTTIHCTAERTSFQDSVSEIAANYHDSCIKILSCPCTNKCMVPFGRVWCWWCLVWSELRIGFTFISRNGFNRTERNPFHRVVWVVIIESNHMNNTAINSRDKRDDNSHGGVAIKKQILRKQKRYDSFAKMYTLTNWFLKEERKRSLAGSVDKWGQDQTQEWTGRLTVRLTVYSIIA